MNGDSMKMNKTPEALKQEALALESMPESSIDTDSIPEVLDFDTAERGRFYRPVKQSVTLRLDADLIAWFQKTSYQISDSHKSGSARICQSPALSLSLLLLCFC